MGVRNVGYVTCNKNLIGLKKNFQNTYVLIVALHYILAWKPRLMMNKSIGGIERYLLVVIKLLMEDLFAVLNDYAQLILGFRSLMNTNYVIPTTPMNRIRNGRALQLQEQKWPGYLN